MAMDKRFDEITEILDTMIVSMDEHAKVTKGMELILLEMKENICRIEYEHSLHKKNVDILFDNLIRNLPNTGNIML